MAGERERARRRGGIEGCLTVHKLAGKPDQALNPRQAFQTPRRWLKSVRASHKQGIFQDVA
jgi:hypothetical protein